MFNCYKIFLNNRLIAIVHKRNDSEFIINCLRNTHPLLFGDDSFKIEGAYIENLGF